MGSKYNSLKTNVDGYKFDSKLEALYYEKLKELKAAGLIENFELQPRYTLFEPFQVAKRKFRRTEYIGDFLIYHIDGAQEVVDIKGMATETAKLKRKIFMYMYGEKIKLTWLKRYKGEWIEI